jgi:hypothetical protein
MNDLAWLLSLPSNLEVWLILGYALLMFAGARLTEFVARAHFERARRYAERGFRYDADEDQYHCPQGERLSLHVIEAEPKIAVYRAPASRCLACSHKDACTPHDEGRHIYRPLTLWVETEVGRFHQRLAATMIASGAVISWAGIVVWEWAPGTGLLLIPVIAGFAILVRDGLRRSSWSFASKARQFSHQSPFAE